MYIELKQFLKKNLKIIPKNFEFYKEAFTHRSYSNEYLGNNLSYERLEFLGDTVINLVISEYLFLLGFDEGHSSKIRTQIVQSSTLIKAAKDLQIIPYIQVGQGLKDNMTSNMYEDVFEAFIAAIYLDQGFDFVKKFIQKNLIKYYQENQLEDATDYKSLLQEHLQNLNIKLIKYLPIKSTIDDQKKKIFNVKVIWNDICYGLGSGKKLKDAEKDAARDAIEKIVIK